MAEESIVENGVHHYSTNGYVVPQDPLIRERLEWFQDQKFALMIHFGLYNQMGMTASWPLSEEDKSWSRAQSTWTEDDKKFRQDYWDLSKSFNPLRFNADEWAWIAKNAGFRYTIMTTKHHDGFCMWDTRQTDYKVTAPDCPYHSAQHPDIIRESFRAFREQGLGIGAYFSKADWHHGDYWDEAMRQGAPSGRMPTYDPKAYPEKWDRFQKFCRNQILELMTGYGKIDILWLDAGWVCPKYGQDLDIPGIVDECRRHQPWLISADRTVGGPYENYVTPEQTVPQAPLNIPWESCLTMGSDFDYRFGDHYKSPREVIRLLVDVVCMGGNLALNLSPQPDGRVPVEAMDSLRGIVQWLRTYGEAIYGTRVCAPYKKDDVAFTRKGDTVYALRMYSDEKLVSVEPRVLIPYGGAVSRISLVDSGETVPFIRTEEGLLVTVPLTHRYGAAPLALVFKPEK